jgi:hypothetical protein
MTSLRWDNVPKPRVERPPLLTPTFKSARWKQTPDLTHRVEGAGRAQTGLHDLAGSARATRATGANRESGRCSSCKARGVTLWRFSGRLVCGNCRGEMWADYHRPRGWRRPARSARVLAQVSALDLRVRPPLARNAWRGCGTFSARSTRRRRLRKPGDDDFGLPGHAGVPERLAWRFCKQP